MIRTALAAAALFLACSARADAAPTQAAPPPPAPPHAPVQAAWHRPMPVPAPWAPQDPADSLYAAGREALARSEFRRAAELFHRIPERFPSSTYAGDALYWEAFARFRLGTDDDLRRALAALGRQ